MIEEVQIVAIPMMQIETAQRHPGMHTTIYLDESIVSLLPHNPIEFRYWRPLAEIQESPYLPAPFQMASLECFIIVMQIDSYLLFTED